MDLVIDNTKFIDGEYHVVLDEKMYNILKKKIKRVENVQRNAHKYYLKKKEEKEALKRDQEGYIDSDNVDDESDYVETDVESTDVESTDFFESESEVEVLPEPVKSAPSAPRVVPSLPRTVKRPTVKKQ